MFTQDDYINEIETARDELSDDFVPCDDSFREVYLTGPAERIG